jgi:hypothetical protein
MQWCQTNCAQSLGEKHRQLHQNNCKIKNTFAKAKENFTSKSPTTRIRLKYTKTGAQ